jgi:methionine-rich copper-binding protein CopC
MQIKKLMVCASVLMFVSSASVVGQAADKEGHEADHTKDKSQKTTDTKPVAKAPIVIEAENLSFSDETGDVFADGNVVVKQNTDVILTDAMRGNQKTTEVWVDGQATLQQPGTNLVGTHTHYNYTTKLGNMQEMKGIVGKDRISGDNVELFPGKLVAYDATSTRCPAIVPDYHMSADRIEIWPGDKMIAYNAKMWIKNVVIYSVPKYQKSLKKEEQTQSAFPRIGYYSNEGVFIKQYLEYPVGDHVAAFTDLGYYSKSGFKPIFGLIDREKTHDFTLVQGEYRDSDGNWIKKEPELKFDLYSRRLGSLPVSFTFNAAYGKWTDAYKTSWHQEENLYFAHDTITLGKGLSLGLGTGLQRVHESYNGSTTNRLKFDTALTKQWSPKWTTTTEYHYTKNNTSLFNYDAADMAREFDLGFTYKIDRMNSIGYRQSYDLENQRIYDQDYTWYRNLHCWQATITYRAKRQQFIWDLSTTRW